MYDKFETLYRHVREVLDPLDIADRTTFEFSGITYLVLLMPPLTEEDLEAGGFAFYTTSTEIPGYDIYIPEDLRPKVRKIVIAHEISEHEMLRQLIDQEYTASKEAITLEKEYSLRREAEGIARMVDEVYARETLDADEYKSYSTLKRFWRT